MEPIHEYQPMKCAGKYNLLNVRINSNPQDLSFPIFQTAPGRLVYHFGPRQSNPQFIDYNHKDSYPLQLFASKCQICQNVPPPSSFLLFGAYSQISFENCVPLYETNPYFGRSCIGNAKVNQSKKQAHPNNHSPCSLPPEEPHIVELSNQNQDSVMLFEREQPNSLKSQKQKSFEIKSLKLYQNYSEKILSENKQLVHSKFEEEPPNSGQSTPCNTNQVKEIIWNYFYTKETSNQILNLTQLEFSIIKVMLIKKLVHDKKKSKIFLQLKNLKLEDLARFFEAISALNRKNIIKSNIFKRIWKILKKKHSCQFFKYYFASLFEDSRSLEFASKKFQISSNSLSDNFYSKCFMSKSFARDFFSILEDPRFKENVIEVSKKKFQTNFSFWISDIIIFLQKGLDPFDIKTKLPDFKFGISVDDFAISSSLFRRFSKKD
jgi:hypothetical protein